MPVASATMASRPTSTVTAPLVLAVARHRDTNKLSVKGRMKRRTRLPTLPAIPYTAAAASPTTWLTTVTPISKLIVGTISIISTPVDSYHTRTHQTNEWLVTGDAERRAGAYRCTVITRAASVGFSH